MGGPPSGYQECATPFCQVFLSSRYTWSRQSSFPYNNNSDLCKIETHNYRYNFKVLLVYCTSFLFVIGLGWSLKVYFQIFASKHSKLWCLQYNLTFILIKFYHFNPICKFASILKIHNSCSEQCNRLFTNGRVHILQSCIDVKKTFSSTTYHLIWCLNASTIYAAANWITLSL